MKSDTVGTGMFVEDHMGCFGDFNGEDPICKRFCALSLRCASEQARLLRMELIEEWVATGDSEMMVQ